MINDFTIKRFNAELLEEAVNKNNNLWVRVKGRCLFPFFDHSSIVQVILCPIEDINRGDLVIFKKDNEVICHRVIKKIRLGEKVLLKTKSDITLCCDPLTEQDMVLGKVTAVKRLRFIIEINNIMSRFIGLFFSFILPIVIQPFLYIKYYNKNELSGKA